MAARSDLAEPAPDEPAAGHRDALPPARLEPHRPRALDRALAGDGLDARRGARPGRRRRGARGARRRAGRAPTGRPPVAALARARRRVRGRPRLRPPAHPRRRSATSRASSWSTTGRPPRSTTRRSRASTSPTSSCARACSSAGIEPRPPARRRHGPRGADRHGRRASIAADGILPGWHGIRPAAEMRGAARRPRRARERRQRRRPRREGASAPARGVDDLDLRARCPPGIGAGLILGGRPYRGVARRRRRDRARAGRPRTGRSAAAATAAAWRPSPARWPSPRCSSAAAARRCRWRSLLELVAAGDRGARRAVADAGRGGRPRARRCSSTSLNPELVVVGGELAAGRGGPARPIRAAIERHGVAPAAGAVRVDRGHAGRPRRGARRGGPDPRAVAARPRGARREVAERAHPAGSAPWRRPSVLAAPRRRRRRRLRRPAGRAEARAPAGRGDARRPAQLPPLPAAAYQVATGALSPGEIAYPLRAHLPRAAQRARRARRGRPASISRAASRAARRRAGDRAPARSSTTR